MLVILDGWGCAEPSAAAEGSRPRNAIAGARTPQLDRMYQSYPHALLGASGAAVGLRQGQMGDSNVGHLNLGAGRIVHQDIVRIDSAIGSGELERDPTIAEMTIGTASRGAALHLMGLLSAGGVHSHINHLAALLRYSRRAGVGRLRVHAFLDGRDVPPQSAPVFLEELEGLLGAAAAAGDGGGGGLPAERAAGGCDYRLATISGRYYAMDRDGRWDRTERAYLAVLGLDGERAAGWREAVSAAYRSGTTDEFVKPCIIGPSERVRDGDAVFFFNFRPERARQLTKAFVEAEGEFRGFERPLPLPAVRFATMTEYGEGFSVPSVLRRQELRSTLGEVVSAAGLRQLRLAETEKYAHVTFFLSGGREDPHPGEDRILIPSPKVATYDLKPEMSAPEVTAAAVQALKDGGYDLIVMNYANCDMVGHTGSYSAAVRAVEAVDRGLGEVVGTALGRGGAALIVADHGNAEEMYDRAGKCPHTAHTTNPVPALLAAEGLPPGTCLRDGILADVAPTVLELIGFDRPGEMTGRSLICRMNSKEVR